METLSKKTVEKPNRPIKILQFGEGNFLRGFADYMIDVANQKGVFDGDIVLVKPIEYGSVAKFHEQDGLYTVVLRGLSADGPVTLNHMVTSVADAVAAVEDYEKYSTYARLDSLRFILSNTTEAGIVYDPTDRLAMTPPRSFPGKLTKFLYERYTHFNGDREKGLIMLPVELIDDNGTFLKKYVLEHAACWGLPADFTAWLEEACVFCSTLVDRIITGYPREEAEKLWAEWGYRDELIVAGELFALWVIESSRDISGELPLDRAGLPVIFTDDQKPYKQRKVRILNGAHTAFVPVSFLAGNDYVRESMADRTVYEFMTQTVFDEVIPTLTLPQAELEGFAREVIARFNNPYIKHALLAISLNSVAKWRARCLPSFLGYLTLKKAVPAHLAFSLAALTAFYRGREIRENALIGGREGEEYKVMDELAVLEFFAANSDKGAEELVNAFLGNEAFFGQDLTRYEGVAATVAGYLESIREKGMRGALAAAFPDCGYPELAIYRIHPADSVAVAIVKLAAGRRLAWGEFTVTVREEIPAGHKIALRDIAAGEAVIKYGYPIGNAIGPIPAGAWIHTHNLQTGLRDLEAYRYEPRAEMPTAPEWAGIPAATARVEIPTATERAEFLGFERKDGRVGVRNEVWIIPTVGCVNNVAGRIAAQAAAFAAGSVEGVIAFPHPYGCSQMGEDQENTRRLLADLITHPNAGGVLVLGLGCENSPIDELKKYLGGYDSDRVKFLVCQEVADEITAGVTLVKELIGYAAGFVRKPLDAGRLVIGLKCGGSDGFSGITANPLVGSFSDLLISKGGTAILTEVPEMFGAERILMNRCENEGLFRQTVNLINHFKNYFISHQQSIYENPSPGNKAGGISTLEDKSLGCTQKSGSAPVRGVLAYGEVVAAAGLNLLSAPGNDLVAATALAASGAVIVLFTTGRGTPFASPVPTVKISSNTELAGKKKNWIDFDAGGLLAGIEPEAMVRELFAYVLRVASGERVLSEQTGYHDMAIFKQGVTL